MNFFYVIKKLLPRRLQIFIRSLFIHKKLNKYKNIWPINKDECNQPSIKVKWPGNKQFALVLTHDVETAEGQDKCVKLLNLEKKVGFYSSFNFIPERYCVSNKVRTIIEEKGYEVGVHGINHDGKLYKNKKIFQNRAIRINKYIKEWGVVGFRSPSMHHNLDWIHELDIEYDSSTFDTDPFEPQPDGVNTIHPLWMGKNSSQTGYVELPYTLPQDFTLFILLREKNIDYWKSKLDWIANNGGMALLNTHPDYIGFEDSPLKYYQYPVKFYKQFLKYVIDKYEGKYWHVLPREMAKFWKENFSYFKK